MNNTIATQFYTDVITGLSASPKYLYSKYFYDARGDELFQQIMETPEYYLTRAEMEIFTQKSAEIAKVILSHADDFDIVELGAGDAVKSTHLLRHLTALGTNYTYYPVDISTHVIELLDNEMPKRIPGIKIHGLNGEYTQMIQEAYKISARRKVILFLGSSIGNFSKEDAERFLQSVQQQLQPGDLLLVGIDLKKNPRQIRAAYDDVVGITKAFNLNLLTRINRELGADFDVPMFDHYASYDPFTGSCRSYLVSLAQQQVTINGTTISFAKNEPVYMELSQKYSVTEIEQMAARVGFKTAAQLYDHNEWFMDIILEKVG